MIDTEVRTAHWHRLLRRAAVADLVVMAFAGVILRDISALAFSGLFLAGLGFLRIRRGLAGVVMLGILALDTIAFMLPAAASNAAHRDGIFGILVPASLVVISLAGVIAAVGGGLRPGSGGRAAPIVTQHAIATFCVAIIGALIAQRGEAEQAARPGDIVVRIDGTSFADEMLTASTGVVRIAAHNRDLFWHTFTIDGVVDLGVPTGAQRRASFTAPPGTYTFVCRVPGHELAGMRGTLTLT